MTTQLNYIIAERRNAELQRPANERDSRWAHAGWRKLPDRKLITPASAHSGRRSPRGLTVLEDKPAIGSER